MSVLFDNLDLSKITATTTVFFAERPQEEPAAAMTTHPDLEAHTWLLDTGSVEARAYNRNEVGLPAEVEMLFELLDAGFIYGFVVVPKQEESGSYASILSPRDCLVELNERYRLAEDAMFQGAVVDDWPLYACNGANPALGAAHTFMGVEPCVAP